MHVAAATAPHSGAETRHLQELADVTGHGDLPLATVLKIAEGRGVPVIVDAAAQRIWVACGGGEASTGVEAVRLIREDKDDEAAKLLSKVGGQFLEDAKGDSTAGTSDTPQATERDRRGRAVHAPRSSRSAYAAAMSPELVQLAYQICVQGIHDLALAPDGSILLGGQSGGDTALVRLLADERLRIARLGIDWRRGEEYFAGHLNDFDLAANNGGWQWAASTGCDAQPYFRIFNPVTQSERFDPDGEYVRRYVPELVAVKGAAVHDPDANVRRAYDYPAPIVDHATEREEALRRSAAVTGR